MRLRKYLSIPVILIVILAATSSVFADASKSDLDVKYSKGLLWKVQTPGAPASYIFGTIHLSDPRVTTLPPQVKQRFSQSRSFTMEILSNAENMQKLASATLIRDGKDLESLLGQNLFSKVVVLTEDFGIPPEILKMIKPWAVMMMLIAPKQESDEVLDSALYKAALEQKKTIYQLESADEQMAVFDNMPLDAQIALLQNTVDYYGELPKLTSQLTQSYLDGDLVAMWKLSNTPLGGDVKIDRYTDLFIQRVLTDRNVVMAERMAQRLQEGAAFIAIGALHLYGHDGVLSLLQRKGYEVSPAY